jgi:hypothetical protein
MKRIVFPALLCIAVLAPSTMLAQEEAVENGRTSLSLRPFGTTTIGVWRQFSPRLELGLEVGASVAQQEGEEEDTEEGRVGVSIEPAAKLYGRGDGDLRPYTAVSLFFTSQEFDYRGDQEDSSTSLGASLGLGLEWTPVERIRIGGHAGVRAGYVHGERTSFPLGVPEVYEIDGWEVATFTSGITFYCSF